MPEFLMSFWQTYNTLIYTVLVHGMLALSIYITLACGQLSLGNAAFMGIGAYTAALFTLKLNAPFAVALLAGATLPAFIALIIGAPVLRLSGVYLAMATLGFGEVVRVVFLNMSITGGSLGLNGIPPKTELWLLAVIMGALIYFFLKLRNSRFGRALEAIREDEVAASVMGINTTWFKIWAFVIGAFMAGLAGGLNAHFTYFLSPREYGFDFAVDILTFAILGGTGTFWGPLVGSTILTILPEMIRFLGSYRLAFNGLILLLVVIYLPNGIITVKRKDE
jgi:branched-chain amino acid transport system permease protein